MQIRTPITKLLLATNLPVVRVAMASGPGSLGRPLPTHHHGASSTTPQPIAAVVVCHDVVRHVRVAPTKHDQPAKTTCRSVEPVEQGAALGGIQDPGSIGNFNTSRFPDQGLDQKYHLTPAAPNRRNLGVVRLSMKD